MSRRGSISVSSVGQRGGITAGVVGDSDVARSRFEGMTLLTVDPGLRAIAVAAWSGARLADAFLLDTSIPSDPVAAAAQRAADGLADYVTNTDPRQLSDVNVVVELPRTYRGYAAKGDANDLIAVGAVCGAIAAMFPNTVFALPEDWKGQVPKKNDDGDNVVRERVLADLTDAEVARLRLPTAESREHNVYDAVGIGLWYLRKVKQRR